MLRERALLGPKILIAFARPESIAVSAFRCRLGFVLDMSIRQVRDEMRRLHRRGRFPSTIWFSCKSRLGGAWTG